MKSRYEQIQDEIKELMAKGYNSQEEYDAYQDAVTRLSAEAYAITCENGRRHMAEFDASVRQGSK